MIGARPRGGATPFRASPYAYQRGAELSLKTTTHVRADEAVRPLRDVIIVEPLEATLSNIIVIVNERRPLRGIVRAVGPGCYPKRYDHPEKHRRTKMWDAKCFQPCDVKVGDLVELGGAELGGYAFETFYWGERLHLICREADVCGVVDESPAA